LNLYTKTVKNKLSKTAYQRSLKKGNAFEGQNNFSIMKSTSLYGFKRNSKLSTNYGAKAT